MHDQSEEDDPLFIPTFDKRGDVKITLDKTAEKVAADVVKQAEMNCEFNRHLDPFFKAENSSVFMSIARQVDFKNYFMKFKQRDDRAKLFEAMRELLLQRGYSDICEIRDKEEDQIMVVRVIEKVDGVINTVVIEDERAKEKMVIKEGLVWIGMICAVKAKWIEGSYKLEKIIDLSAPIPQIKAHLTASPEASRMLIIKGSFRSKYSNQDTGIRVIANQLLKFKKQNVIINQLIVLGPILSKSNKDVQNCNFLRTFQQQYEIIVITLKNQLTRIIPNIQIFILPSLDDIVALHPMPQPAYQPQNREINVKFVSNPCSINYERRRSTVKIDFVNYDILKAIQAHKSGKTMMNTDLLQETMQTYMKQPFWLTNTISAQDPFDEVNIGNLFNNGQFGDLVVFSSSHSPPFVKEVAGRVILNVGALGIDYHYTGKNFMVLASFFEGDGPAHQRIRIDSISQG